MFGKFDDQVASKEPRKISRDYGILLKKVRESDREQNRVLMLTDFDSGRPMPVNLRRMQHEVLPSIKTKNFKIEYRIEAMVSHDGTFSSN